MTLFLGELWTLVVLDAHGADLQIRAQVHTRDFNVMDFLRVDDWAGVLPVDNKSGVEAICWLECRNVSVLDSDRVTVWLFNRLRLLFHAHVLLVVSFGHRVRCKFLFHNQLLGWLVYFRQEGARLLTWHERQSSFVLCCATFSNWQFWLVFDSTPLKWCIIYVLFLAWGFLVQLYASKALSPSLDNFTSVRLTSADKSLDLWLDSLFVVDRAW